MKKIDLYIMLSGSEKLFPGTIEPGVIYFFWHIGIQHSTLPHPMVLVAISENNALIFSTGTSDKELTKEYLSQRTDVPPSTFVCIYPSKENCLDSVTWIDCNELHPSDISTIVEKFKDGTLKYYHGHLESKYFAQILKGIHESPLVTDIQKAVIPSEIEFLDSI